MHQSGEALPSQAVKLSVGGAETPPVLSIRDLSVSYRGAAGTKSVLSSINIDVEEGEFLCIVGPSGTGKTTLIRCIAGLMAPTTGTLELDGERIMEPPARLAFVSQDYGRSLMPWLRIEDNVRLPLRGKGIPKSEIKERVGNALTSVNLARAARSYPWQLSGGMQQRASIARALAYHPEILVMDEPFASVDAQTRAELEDLILGLQQKTAVTIVLVTHDIDEAVYLGDRVVVLGGSPASVHHELKVDLGSTRDQLSTKAQPQFAAYRSDILARIRSAREQAILQ
jgi:NitT/TauT family transport system ATP-binding protein